LLGTVSANAAVYFEVAMRKRHFPLFMLCVMSALANAAPDCRDMDLGFTQAGWTALPLSKLKKDTRYTVSTDGVLSAEADAAASLFAVPVKPAVAARHISWRWQTDALIPGADNRDKSKEDAPLRIILAFDGNRETLADEDKRKTKWAKRMSGREPPYATLMYIWSEQVPVETVIPSAHSGQVKMLVVASGKTGLGQWQTLRRDLRADYKRAFDADPGLLVGVGAMTDTDNTGAKALGRYAGIRLDCSK
jgi:hypothetical protein